MSKLCHRCPLLNMDGLCGIQPRMLVATREWFEHYCFGTYEHCLLWRCYMACLELRRTLVKGGGEQLLRKPQFDVEMPVKVIGPEYQ